MGGSYLTLLNTIANMGEWLCDYRLNLPLLGTHGLISKVVIKFCKAAPVQNQPSCF